MKSLVLLILFILFSVSCSMDDPDKGFPAKTDPVCRASYDERTDTRGQIHFRFTSYWVNCYGQIGRSKADCVWRTSD